MKLSAALVPVDAARRRAGFATSAPKDSGSAYFPSNHGSANGVAGTPQNLKNALVLLRAEGLKLQSDDGGTLTAEHRAHLQAKMDRPMSKHRHVTRALKPALLDLSPSAGALTVLVDIDPSTVPSSFKSCRNVRMPSRPAPSTSMMVSLPVGDLQEPR